MKFNSTTWMLQGPVSAILLIATASSAFAAPASDWRTRVSPDLLAIYDSATAPIRPSIKATAPPGSIIERSTARFDASGRVQIDINFDCASAVPAAELKVLGFVTGVSLRLPPLCVVEGWATTAALPSIATVASVKTLTLPHYSAPKHPIAQAQSLLQPQVQSASGQTIDGSAITLTRADQFITQTGKTGAGITIGVISDDATSYQLIQGRAELPALQIVPTSLTPMSHTTLTDEGTMMLQEVYAIAPGAALLFCGPETDMEYIQCVQQLAGVGATVITDDTGYPTVDIMAANNSDTLAVQAVLSQYPSLSLFTAGDNFNGSYWQGNYTPTLFSAAGFAPQICPATGQTDYYFNNFGGSAFQLLTVQFAGTYPVVFQWADPNERNQSNFDVYVVNMNTSVVSCFPVSGLTASRYTAMLPFDLTQYRIFIATPDQSLNGKFMKLLIGGDGATNLSVPTPGSVASFQAFLPSVMTVGAVVGSDGIGNTIEWYSALGPTTLVYPASAQLQAPMLVAPDAIYVDAVNTKFESELGTDGFFHGTSAASPNAAAVAALIRSAFPNLTPAQVNTYLLAGATPIGAVPNMAYGYGRVDALGALAQIPAPTISGLQGTTIVGGSSSQPLPFTIGGIGTLKVNVTAAIFNAVVAPANCGSSSGTCTITLTPPIGALGTATVQVTVTDGANRSSSTQFAVTITKPTPPTIMITSGGTQSVTVNGAIAPIAFTLSGTGTLTVTPNTSDVSSITISSGCGTTTMNCTATLGNAQSSPGTATLTLTVEDPYVQSATASATVTENAVPAKSGGGSLDPWALLGLTGLILIQLTKPTRKQG